MEIGGKKCSNDSLESFFISKEWIWLESANNQDPLLPQSLFGFRDKIVAGLEEHIYTELSTSLVVLDFAISMDAKESTGLSLESHHPLFRLIKSSFSILRATFSLLAISITVSLISCVKFIAGLSSVCVSLSDLGS